MNIRLTDIWLRLALALLIGAGLAGCADEGDIPGGGATGLPADMEMASFTVRVAPVDAPDDRYVSRAGDDVVAPLETMNSLRIVILSEGRVEVNSLVPLLENAHEYLGIYKVRPSVDKTVYAIANPESTGFDFDSYPVGSAGIDAALEAHYYTFDPSRPIAMTDCRTVAGSLIRPGTVTDLEMQVVRVAAKFSVDITNNRKEDLTVTAFSLGDVGMTHYLMPHFTGTDGRHVINSQGLSPFDFDDRKGLHWSDWLALAVEESQAAPEDQTVADRRGWVMKYAVPAGTVNAAQSVIDTPVSLPRSTRVALPVHYCGETVSLLGVPTGFGAGAATGFEQGYTFSVTFRDSRGENISFTDRRIPNLRSLFRNTHAVVHITLNQHSLEVDVIPYAEVTLKPDFGIVRDNETGWIIIDKYAPRRYYYDDQRHVYYDGDKNMIATRVEPVAHQGGHSVFAVRDMKTNLLKYTFDYTDNLYYLDEALTSRISTPADCPFLPRESFLEHDEVIVLRYDEYGKALFMYDPRTGKSFNEVWSPLASTPNFAIQRYENSLGYEGYMILTMTDYRTPVFLYSLADDRYFRYDTQESGVTLTEVEAFPPR